MTDVGIKIGPYFRTLHSGVCDLFTELGKFPVQTVTTHSFEPKDLKDPVGCPGFRPVNILPCIGRISGSQLMINEKVNRTHD